MSEVDLDSRGGDRKWSRIESTLLARGLVSEQTLIEARDRQRGAKRPLVEVLLEQGAVDEPDLVAALSDATGAPILSGAQLDPDETIRGVVPFALAQQLGILPLRVEDDELVVATGDPFQLPAFDRLQTLTDLRIRRAIAAPSAIRAALSLAEPEEEALNDFLKHTPEENTVVMLPMPDQAGDAEGGDSEGGDEDDGITIDTELEDAPVIRLLNLILADAIRQGSSDIHIEPEKAAVRVRFRIDGDLQPMLEVPPKIRARLLARLKIVAGLDTMETRIPQDGRAKVILDRRSYDLRVSTLPSYFGEKAVIRILDSSSPTFSLDNSGIDAPVLASWRDLLHRPQGLLLVTGPTGSGKSSTLYASILELREATRNIITVEDPVEYQFPGIVHVPVRADIGMTFAAALRSILRQDPDTILIGEIRDAETAEIAIRAAMTGHLVLSTLHTNDAVGAITRLLDLGLTPHLLGSCLLGVMAQRLVRTVCEKCAETLAYPPAALEALRTRLPPDIDRRTKKGKGCATCRGTGQRGRTAIAELVRMTPGLQGLIHAGATEEEIAHRAREDGMRTLFESGVEKILAGISTPENVLKVAAPEVDATGRDVNPGIVAVAKRDRVCQGCEKSLEPEWRVCPFCGGEPEEEDENAASAIICDDSALMRHVISGALKSDFPRIYEAANGREALDLVFQTQADLLVVDQEMPVMTGTELIADLRSRIETATLPIIMLTSNDSDELECDVLDLGADDYLRKPITPERLRARVNAVMNARVRAVRAEAALNPRRDIEPAPAGT